MICKPFGSTGIDVPEIGQGTWDIPESGRRAEEARQALRRGIELGMTHVDTAEMYGAGRVEEIAGEAIAGIDRDRLFITSKVLPSNASFEETIAACERSLQRMGLSYFDLYLLHWPSTHPLEQTMEALERLVKDGKTRYIGVSNFDLDELREAQSFLRNVPLSCNQVLYNLGERGVEVHLLPYCRKSGIAVVGYTPFGRSHFSHARSHDDRLLERIGTKYDKTERQVILRFLTR
ncbi:MAG: aldo/keto reductase, partial [Candidatus Eremiobacteraeota bacterium]|nr:aldo/keto reductase [Candidatus Eremiobacteraeota bacterium]